MSDQNVLQLKELLKTAIQKWSDDFASNNQIDAESKEAIKRLEKRGFRIEEPQLSPNRIIREVLAVLQKDYPLRGAGRGAGKGAKRGKRSAPIDSGDCQKKILELLKGKAVKSKKEMSDHFGDKFSADMVGAALKALKESKKIEAASGQGRGVKYRRS